MDISFASRKLQRDMTDPRRMGKAYGKLASKLMLRLGVLDSARCLADVPHEPPDRRHQLVGGLEGHFAVDLSRNERLVFRPAHDPVPTKGDGGIDLEAVTAIEIVSIGDYH